MPWDAQDDFSGGLYLDGPSHTMPANCVHTADNMLFDRGKSARLRGAISSNESSATTAVATRLAYYKSGGHDAIERLVGVGVEKLNGGTYPSTATVYLFNESTFAITTLEAMGGSDVTYIGKPFQHLDFLVLPHMSETDAGSAFRLSIYGGAATNHSITTPTVTLSSGDQLATVTVGNTTGMEPGDMLHISGTADYVGRVTSVINSTSFTVMPVPTFTEAGMSCAFDDIIQTVTAGSAGDINAKFGVSFQNRIILAHTITDTGASLELHPRRIAWTILPDEMPSSYTANDAYGYSQLYGDAFEPNNYLEIPDNEPITGLAKMGEGQLLIFGQTGCYRLTGQLQTQTATTGGVQTVDLRRIPYGFGLVELGGERSIQQSKRGLIFASPEGVMAYDGSRFYPLMQGSIERYWRSFVEADFPIFGSAMMDDRHYLISSSTESFYVNLDTLAWGRSTDPCMRIFDSVRGLSNSTSIPPRTYALRSYNTGSPPSTTAQLLLLNEAVKYPPATTGEDDDGTDLTFTLITRPLTHGDEATPKAYRDVRAVGYVNGTGTPDVEMDVIPGLDPDNGAFSNVFDPLTESVVATRTRWATHIPAASRRDYAMSVRVRKDDAGTNTSDVEIDEVAIRATPMSSERMSGI